MSHRQELAQQASRQLVEALNAMHDAHENVAYWFQLLRCAVQDDAVGVKSLSNAEELSHLLSEWRIHEHALNKEPKRWFLADPTAEQRIRAEEKGKNRALKDWLGE